MIASSSLLWRIRLIRLLTLVGLLLVMVGGGLVTVSPPDLASSGAASAITLSLTTTASGATCDNNTNPVGPVCSGLANGDVVNVSGSGFSPGATASIVECSSVATQPVIAPYPVSCSLLSPTTIPSSGPNTGELVGTYTLRTGTLGPPVMGGDPTCQTTVGWPTTFPDVTIANCTTSGNAATDAAMYPCPPTVAQQAAGYVCTLGIMDSSDERVVGAALFGSETLPLCSSVVATTYPTFPCGTISSTSSTSTISSTSSTSTISSTSSTSTTTTPANTTTTNSGPAPTTLTSSLSGGGQSGGTIVVPWATPVSDQVALNGANSSSAGGTVTYAIFSFTLSFFQLFPFFGPPSFYNWSWVQIGFAGLVNVSSGSVPASEAVSLPAGVYLWQALYSGDALNGPSSSTDGLATEIVTPSPGDTNPGGGGFWSVFWSGFRWPSY